MKWFNQKSDYTMESLYPQKRRYFNFMFMGPDHDAQLLEKELSKSLPEDWPVNAFMCPERIDRFNVNYFKTMMAASNAAVFWCSKDVEIQSVESILIWTSCLTKVITSDKKRFLGSVSPSIMNLIADIASGPAKENWYWTLPSVANSLSELIDSELIEEVFSTLEINVKPKVKT